MDMNSETLEEKRERIKSKFKASRERKRAHLILMEERMRETYKKRTGQEATDFNVI